MNETSAREVLLIQAFETAEPPSSSWNEVDGAWASRQALFDKTIKRSLDDFIALRAKIALQRLSQREPEITESLATGWWRWSMLTWALLIGLVFGGVANSIGSSQFINLLAPPIIFVVLWNIVLYVWLLLNTIISKPKDNRKPHLLVRLVQRILRSIGNSLSGIRTSDEPALNRVIENFTKQWISCSAPLFIARSTMLLHAAAGALGLGLIAGLYMRGIVFDYRAAWESTFLSANTAHSILRIVLAPAIWLPGISFPDELTFSAMRMVHGSNSTGVSAASWIHMYSLTLLMIVVIPRFILMVRYGLSAKFLSQDIKLRLNEKYFSSLSTQNNGDVPPPSIIIGLAAHSNADKMAFLKAVLGNQGALKCELDLAKEFQCIFPLIETKEEHLQLWNTPNFGESAQLVKQLRESGEPLSKALGRLLDSEFQHTQQVINKMKDDGDVILYLVNAIDKPDIANFVKHELDILNWIGRPMIVLLNQNDSSCESNVKIEAIESWRVYLAEYSNVKAIMVFDEFAHCWMTNDRLYKKVEDLLAGERKLLTKRLRSAKRAQQIEILDSVSHSISCCISPLVTHFETIDDSGALVSTIRQIVNSKDVKSLNEAAQKRLSEKLEKNIQINTSDLLTLYGFTTNDIGKIQMPDTNKIETRGDKVPVMWSAILSGALTGLTADILSGGLTLGGGLIAGGIAGAVGAKGLNSVVNLVRRSDGRFGVQWSTEVLDSLLENALLRYLAIIHCHRDENSLRCNQSNLQWCEVIKQIIDPHRDSIKKTWQLRDIKVSDSNNPGKQIADNLQPIIKQALYEILNKLYPGDLQIELH